MEKKRNPKRITANRTWYFTIGGVFLMFGPVNLGLIDGMDGGYAIATLGFMIALAGIISFFVYNKLAKSLEDILHDENLIAHWTYPLEQWTAYAEKDYREDKKYKMQLFYIVAAFAIFFAVLFMVIDPEAGLFVAATMLGLIIIVRLTVFITVRNRYKENKSQIGEVYIAPNGVYLNKQLHAWNVIGSRLERVFYNSNSENLIRFEYSAPGRGARSWYSFAVPVPAGKEVEACSIVDFFNKALLEKKKV